jgi:hypothetical protein
LVSVAAGNVNARFCPAAIDGHSPMQPTGLFSFNRLIRMRYTSSSARRYPLCCYLVFLLVIPLGDFMAPAPLKATTITYPYVATPQRQKRIKRGIGQIKPGMPIGKVRLILGRPDLIRTLYEPKVWHPKQIGKTYWYFIEVHDKGDFINAKLVRVSVGHDGKVLRVAYWGFSLPSK